MSLSKFIILDEFTNHATNALTKLVCRSTQWYPYPSQQINCLIVMPIMLQQPGWLCQCMASTAHLVHWLGFYPCIHHALCMSMTISLAPYYLSPTDQKYHALQKQSCYVSKVFGYYNYVTIINMKILWMLGWKKGAETWSDTWVFLLVSHKMFIQAPHCLN